MKISDHLVMIYISFIEAYLATHDLAPDRAEEWDPDIDNMGKAATMKGDMEILRLAIEHILEHPEINAEALFDTPYALGEEAARAALARARQRLWPDAGPIPKGGPPGVALIHMPEDEWRAARARGEL
jgi:hypothetical protein